MNINEIAKLAGVSSSTVSKVVNKKDQHISEDTRKKVLQIVKEYNYTPYSSYKKKTRSFLLGLLINNLENKSSFIQGIIDQAQFEGYTILLLDSKNNSDTELKHITNLISNEIDLLIWEPVGSHSYANEHLIIDHSIEYSIINDPKNKNSFQIDYTEFAYFMTKEILKNNHRNIVFHIPENHHFKKQLINGFKKCLFNHDVGFKEEMIINILTQETLLDYSAKKVTAFLFTNQSDAYKAKQYLTNYHYKIPTDLSIITLAQDYSTAQSQFTEIIIPNKEFGFYLAENLINKSENKKYSKMKFYGKKSLCVANDSLSLANATNSKKTNIIVVGSINMDTTFSVDNIPQSGSITKIINSIPTIGGKGVNQSIGVSRLGGIPILVGAIGNDFESKKILLNLEEENVIISSIYRNHNSETGKAYIFTQNNGESSISISPGANTFLTSDYIYSIEHIFKNASFCLLNTEIPIEVVFEASRLAKKNNLKTILKPSMIKSLPSDLLEYIDYLVPNKEEATNLAPNCETLEDQADFFLQKAKKVIITLGDEGCYYKDKDHSHYFPASKFRVTDTTGGADAFISALAVFLDQNYPIFEAIRIAQYAAGFSVSKYGASNSLIDENTLKKFISFENY